uniref:Uncharacterized protein n=1 Tax=Cannabis sativa TaxID=3483 RepID=A0A803NUB6_CANSA
MTKLKVFLNCEIATYAWEKLKKKNEETEAVKKARLRVLAKSFENLSMDENESVFEFHAKICDILNESYAIGKAYEEMFAQWSYMAKRVKELQDLNKALDDSKIELEEKLKCMTIKLCSKDSEIYKLTAELVRAKQPLSYISLGIDALN